MRWRKVSFDDLVAKNKQELINDKQAMKQIEEQLDNKQAQQVTKQKTKYVN